MKKIVDILWLNCLKASESIEKEKLVGLSAAEAIKLKMHLAVCDPCRSYQKHSNALDAQLNHFFVAELERIKGESSSEERINRILEKLNLNRPIG